MLDTFYCRTRQGLNRFDDKFSDCINLDEIEKNASKIICPTLSGNIKACYMMLVSNLAEPQWVTVNCYQKILPTVLCFRPSNLSEQTQDNNTETLHRTSRCLPWQFVVPKSCYYLKWFESVGPIHRQKVCLFQDKVANHEYFQEFKPIFMAIGASFPTFLVSNNINKSSAESGIQTVICQKQSKQPHCKTNSIPEGGTEEGYFICKGNYEFFFVGIHLFNCTNGVIISSMMICDGQNDCLDDSDEEICTAFETTSGKVSLVWHQAFNLNFSLNNSSLDKHLKSCPYRLYYQSSDGFCAKYAVKFLEKLKRDSSENNLNVSCDTQTVSQTNISFDEHLENDLFVDSIFPDKEERDLIDLLTRNNETKCPLNHLPCLEGHSKCYNISNICHFSLDIFCNLQPCRNGGHLEDCTTFNCNHRYKCRKSFCIPWKYLCDGKWDCDSGEDEDFHIICGKKDRCENMIKCSGFLGHCIPLGKVCDGENECQHFDDEHLCQVKEIICPSHCVCFALAISCEVIQTNFDSKFDFLPFLSISIVSSRNLLPSSLFNKDAKALFLWLNRNNLEEVCGLNYPKRLYHLDFSFNSLSDLRRDCVKDLSNLTVVELQHNQISSVSSSSFRNLTSLKFINLAENCLSKLPLKFIHHKEVPFKLIYLSLKNSTFNDIETNFFQSFTSKYIEATDYQVCCIAPPTAQWCSAKKPWYRSCEDLLPNQSLRTIFIVVSASTLTVNVISIITHALSTKFQKTFRATVISLNSNDFLIVVYLGIIWICDLVLSGKFLVNDQWWRSSVFCFGAFSVLIWFNLSSQLSLIFLSLSRLMVVLHPMDTEFKKLRFVVQWIVALEGLSVLVSLTVALVAAFVFKEVPLTLCLPFVDPTKQVAMIDAMAWLTAISQLATTIAVLVMHVLLVNKVVESGKNLNKSGGEDSNTALIVQLLLITISNIICWFPANVIYVLALFLESYQTELITGTAVGITPINSVFNPCVFIGFAIRKYLKEK